MDNGSDDFYKPPSANLDRETHDAAAERIREEHIAHEASIRSTGCGCGLIFACIALVIAGLVFAALSGGVSAEVSAESGLPVAVMIGFYSVLLLLYGASAYGLRNLKPWARIPAGIVAGIGLLGFPIGTIINGYILYLLFSSKGATVFSDEYKRVIAQTPQVKHKTSPLLFVLLLLIVGAIILAAFSGAMTG